MSTYYYISNDYLAHHGVKGMHWGIRKAYERSAIRRTGDRIQGTAWRMKTKASRFRDAHGVGNKASEIFGYGAMRTNAQAHQRTQKALAEHSKTKLAQNIHKQHSENAGYLADYASNMKKSSVGDKALELMVPINYLKTPYKRLSGRTTTVGKNYVNYALTYGTFGLFQDAGYISTQRAINKTNHRKPSASKKGK